MWNCSKCNEKLGDDFDSCWSCGYNRDGTPPNVSEKKEILNSKKEMAFIAQSEKNSRPSKRQEVVIVDIEIPFGSMIVFMVKWAIASIPAFIILVFIGILIASFFNAAFG